MKGPEEPSCRVAAIVLNYNAPGLTINCFQSLKQQSSSIDQMVVVDNGSKEPLPGKLEELIPDIRQIHLEQNRGFSCGVNAGIQSIPHDLNHDYVWLLNNDVICGPTVLKKMLAHITQDPEMAAVGCMMEELEDNGQIVQVIGGHFPNRFFLVPYVSRPGAPVDYLCGACVLIRREALEDVGLLDENYFFFFEDADWSFRAAQKGWKLGVCNEAVISHQRSSTIGKLHRLRASYYRAGYIRFLCTYSKIPYLTALMTTAYRLVRYAWKRQWESFYGTIEGWRKGWSTIRSCGGEGGSS